LPTFNVKYVDPTTGERVDRKIDADNPNRADALVRKEVGGAIHVLRIKLVREKEPA
jgi:hypothetical protein